MEAVAHNPSFARMVKVPQSVGQDFVMADKRDHYGTAHMSDFSRSLKQGEKRTKIKKELRVGGNTWKKDYKNLFRVY